MEKEKIDLRMFKVECEMKNGTFISFVACGNELAKEVLKEEYFDNLVTYKIWGLVDDGFNPKNMYGN